MPSKPTTSFYATSKVPTSAGHDNNPSAKVEIIERMDQMLGMILENIPPKTYIVLTDDHSTPCPYMDHSGDPVPVVIWGPGVRTDSVTDFGERSAARGGMGRIRGKDILNILTGFLKVQEKFGA